MKITLQQFALILILLFFFAFNAYAQETRLDKVVLKTGESYVGEIVVQTPEIILIKTKDGGRFQFPLTSVRSIEKKSANATELSVNDSLNAANKLPPEIFCLMIDLSGGFSKGIFSYPWSPAGEVSMSFGTKELLGKTIFAGLGVGYKVTSTKSTSEMTGFIPVFIRMQSFNLKKYRTAPYLSLDAGYAFSTNSKYGGGTFAKLSAGIIHKMTYKLTAFGGLYVRTQGFSGKLTQPVDAGEVTYVGNSSINDFGLKVGVQF